MSIIIKLEHSNAFQSSLEGCKIQKFVSSISPKTFIQLLKEADNKVNPRSAKINRITKSIHETLESSPELFWFKSKGLLIATKQCELLDRNRARISLSDTDVEGIMDGGHNTLAIASFLLAKLFDERIKIRDWEGCKSYWADHYDEILERFNERAEEFSFSIPIEIIAPNDMDGSLDVFYDSISEICSARNNNVQLTEVAKGNQEGYYETLKQLLGGDYDVIWKAGEAGRIKADDVIAMASLGLIFLDYKKMLPENVSKTLNRVSLYSQKSKCVEFYNALMADESVSENQNGKSVLKNELIQSALSLTGDILKYFDRLYSNFPALYNNVSPGFGRISSVKRTPSKSPFGTISKEVEVQYPHGFFYPLLYGLVELMRVDELTNNVSWTVDPATIDLMDLDISQYVDLIKMANYDPQKTGKSGVFYNEAENVYRKYISTAASK